MREGGREGEWREEGRFERSHCTVELTVFDILRRSVRARL